MGGIGSGRNPRWKDLQIVDICKLSVTVIGRYLSDEKQSLRDRALIASHFAKRLVPERIQADVQRKLSNDEMIALTEQLSKALAIDADVIRADPSTPALDKPKGRGSVAHDDVGAGKFGGTPPLRGFGNPPHSTIPNSHLDDSKVSASKGEEDDADDA